MGPWHLPLHHHHQGIAGSTEIVAAFTVANAIERLFTVFVFGVAGTAAILVGRRSSCGRKGQRV